MPKYRVITEEIVRSVIFVDADNEDEAVQVVEQGDGWLDDQEYFAPSIELVEQLEA